MIKEIIADCLLFSLWEGIYFYLFARSYSNIRLKFYQICIMIVTNSIIGIVFPPTIKQIVFIVFMTLYFFAFSEENITQCLKTVIISFMILFTIEVLYSVPLEYIINVKSLVCDLQLDEQFVVCIYLMPIRVVEYIIAYKIREV